jgi:hypothetical protein
VEDVQVSAKNLALRLFYPKMCPGVSGIQRWDTIPWKMAQKIGASRLI